MKKSATLEQMMAAMGICSLDEATPAIDIHHESDDYSWGKCVICGNTVKFGGGLPLTICPACSTPTKLE